MFNSNVSRGEQAFGFIKVPDRIDFRLPASFGYDDYSAPFHLALKWRQKYFDFMTGGNPIPPGH